jgi:hypothetical protein
MNERMNHEVTRTARPESSPCRNLKIPSSSLREARPQSSNWMVDVWVEGEVEGEMETLRMLGRDL